MSPPVLEAHAIAKRFGGVIALRGVSFSLAAGEIHALCGENGAGKSTLIKLLAGIHPHGSYDGRIEVDGQEVRFQSARDAESAGIAVRPSRTAPRCPARSWVPTPTGSTRRPRPGTSTRRRPGRSEPAS